MKIVCISDTHLQHDFSIPDGDLLIHAGDGTGLGSLPEIRRWFEWLVALPHRHKLVIAGNHDKSFENGPFEARRLITTYLERGITYLQDSGCAIGGLKFWGSPWQPWFYDWAFNLERGEPLRKKWALIPDVTDVLITHGPPAGLLDRCPDGRRVGCDELRSRIDRLKLRLHVFGHIHCENGTTNVNGTTFVNASICDESYRPTGTAFVVDLAPRAP